jgi:eukaryotic-like serine/threonine-protein kinase
VREADWATDGKGLAVVRRVGTRERLEYPVDHVLYETDGYISHPRFSRQGDRIAFLDHPVWGDDRGWSSVVDLTGHKTNLTAEYPLGISGLAWSPSGDEVWFSANRAGGALALRGVSLAGQERVVWRGPGSVWLMDVAPDGRALLCETVMRGEVFADGRLILLSNLDEPSGPNYSAYLRTTDGSPAIRLGEGMAQGLFVTPQGESPTRIYRFDLATGRRVFWQEIAVADRGGMSRDPIIRLAPDGKTRVYTVIRYLTDLYLVEGLK